MHTSVTKPRRAADEFRQPASPLSSLVAAGPPGARKTSVTTETLKKCYVCDTVNRAACPAAFAKLRRATPKPKGRRREGLRKAREKIWGDAVEAIIEANPALTFGIHHRLLNLTKVSRFLRPSVEAQTRKEVSDAGAPHEPLAAPAPLARRARTRILDALVLDKVSIVSGLVLGHAPEDPDHAPRAQPAVHRRPGAERFTQELSQ